MIRIIGTNKMKIAFLNKYQNKVYRGAETFVQELSKRLRKEHKVDVISDIKYSDLFKKHYDVVIPTNGRFQVILVRIITWLKNEKMIVSGQSGMGWDDKINLLVFPDTFAALSSEALKWAKKVNPFVKSVYIPNGVDIGKFTSARGKAKTILAAGAFTKQKRLDLAIDAVSKILGAKLIIAGGGGDLKDKIYNLGMKKLGKERFEILSVPFSEMPSIYKKASVFTLPSSSSESFGNVIIEAMASGLPVVVTKDPVRREIVGEAGFLVNPTNANEYAEALEKAFNHNWGDSPRKQAEKFSWDKVAEKYLELIKNI